MKEHTVLRNVGIWNSDSGELPRRNYLPACEEGTDRVLRNVGIWNSDAGELPRRKNLPAYEEGTECSETSAYTIQTPGNYPEESTFPPMKKEQNVPKHRHIQFGRRGITQKKVTARLRRRNRVFRNVGMYNSDAGELPRRKHTTTVIIFYGKHKS
jgi:hypothetical protein